MFGERLQIALNNKNETQTSLAQELGFTQQAVSRWCNGTTEPDNPTIVKIAKFLNVSTDFLLGNDEILSDNEQEIKEKLILKSALIKAGYMKDKENLSDEELDRLMKFAIANREFIRRKS